ncbi:MAG: hypothetical protein JWQ19_2810 [Subtercola sp.]|nr:hypothetical protein [Subtercola sp.]
MADAANVADVEFAPVTIASLTKIGQSSPVFTMIGGVDTPDGAVCGIDGVCVVPGESSTTASSTTGTDQ